jgi:ABC-type multidrug transport system fused ATPase/permease subunit
MAATTDAAMRRRGGEPPRGSGSGDDTHGVDTIDQVPTIAGVAVRFTRANAATLGFYALILLLLAAERIGVPHFYGKMIDAVRKADFGRVYWLFGLLVGIFVAYQALDTGLTLMDADLMPRFESAMRSFMVDRLLLQLREAYTELQLGDITSKLIKLPAHMRALFQRVKVFTFNHVLSVVLSAAYLFYCHWAIGAVFSANFVVIALTTYLFCTRCASSSCARESTFDETQEGIQDILYNLLAVYTGHGEARERARVDAYNRTVNARTRDYIVCGLPYRAVLAACFVSVFAGTTYLGLRLFQQGAIELSILVSSFIVSFSMLRTCMSFYFDFDSFLYVYGGIQVVCDFLRALPAYVPAARPSPDATELLVRARADNNSAKDGPPPPPPTLEVVRVSFAAPGDPARRILREVSVRVPPGSTLVLTGRIGSGKSTLGKLLARLLRPTSGHVLLDGVDVRRIPLPALRRIVYYSPQAPRLFNRTLYENLVYGCDPPPAEEEIYGLLRQLDMHDVARTFRARMHRRVGKNGHRLSGGQQQVTALLRAYYRRARIYVMDEPTSALDPASREHVVRLIRHMRREATVIVITHDASVFEDGRARVVSLESLHLRAS